MDKEQIELTQIKIVCLTLLIAFLGIFFFAYKVEACKSNPEVCHDQFLAFDNNSSPACPAGAIMEIVKEPKAGTICHCAASVPDASAK